MQPLRLTLFALFVAVPSVAFGQAAPCPTFTAGWAQSYSPPITAVTYDETKLQMYIVWNYTMPTAYAQVPFSVIQTFARSKNPVQTYNLMVANTYPSLLLQEKNNCPILTENGQFISTNGISR